MRQLLNALHIVVLYQRENPKITVSPRTFFFGGKAAPAYTCAKLVTTFINNLGTTIDGDPGGETSAHSGVGAGEIGRICF